MDEKLILTELENEKFTAFVNTHKNCAPTVGTLASIYHIKLVFNISDNMSVVPSCLCSRCEAELLLADKLRYLK